MAEAAQTTVFIREQPLKVAEASMTIDEIAAQADFATQATAEVSATAYGTCIDERPRAGVKSGDEIIEPRESAPGGPVIYGLYAAEMLGDFGEKDADNVGRLLTIIKVLKDDDIQPGGHDNCAANASFKDVLSLIGGSNREPGREYAKEQLGDDFDNKAFDEAADAASAAAESGRYDDWDESFLAQALGSTAGLAIETLKPIPHKGRTLVRDYREGQTVDQTTLHDLANEDSFINDEPYEDRIEAAVAKKGGDVEWRQKVARHGREALLAALVVALPNEEIHQIDLRPTA